MTGAQSSISSVLYLVGYVLEQRESDLRYTKLPQKIGDFCKQRGYSLIFTEQEVGASKNMCRSGLWRVTRALVCYQCDPDVMPVSYDVEAWVQRAMKFCKCSKPTGVAGIVIKSINTLCTEPTSGSKYVLALAVARKHLFVVDEGKCISCCNPAAKPFMDKARL